MQEGKISVAKNILNDYASKFRGRIDNFSYETLNKLAYGAEAAKLSFWTASTMLSTSFSDFALTGVINVASGSQSLLDYDIRKNRPESEYLPAKKASTALFAGLGGVFLTIGVADAISGRFERLPHDATATTASFAQASSEILHHFADRKKI